MNRKEISPYFEREKSDKEFIDFVSNDGRGIVVVFQAYFDESGTHTNSPLVVVAGWIGNRKAWESFIEEWNLSLEKVGISGFHAKDPKCEALKIPLAKAILKRNLYAVAWAVTRSDFRNNVSNRFMNQFGNEYSTCAYHCVGSVMKYMKDNGYYEVALVFEDGQPNSNIIHETVSSMIASPEDTRLISIDFLFKNNSRSIPLQAADFLAHAIATNESQWVKLFKKHERFYNFFTMYPEIIKETTRQIETIIAHNRAERKKAKKERMKD